MKGAVGICVANTAALIYAGGQATRMGGVNKAFALFEGRRLISHVIERVQPQCDKLFISANRDLYEFSKLADAVIPDVDEGYPGPLAALAAFAEAGLSQYEWVLTVPCDAPWVPVDMLVHFAFGASGHEARGRNAASCDAFYAVSSDGRKQPAFALIRCELLKKVRPYLAEEGRRLGGFLCSIGAEGVAFDCPTEAFINLNSFEECRKAEKCRRSLDKS